MRKKLSNALWHSFDLLGVLSWELFLLFVDLIFAQSLVPAFTKRTNQVNICKVSKQTFLFIAIFFFILETKLSLNRRLLAQSDGYARSRPSGKSRV